jgi:hypothetical protein
MVNTYEIFKSKLCISLGIALRNHLLPVEGPSKATEQSHRQGSVLPNHPKIEVLHMGCRSIHPVTALKDRTPDVIRCIESNTDTFIIFRPRFPGGTMRQFPS